MIYTLMSIYLFAHATTSAGDTVLSVCHTLIAAPKHMLECVCVWRAEKQQVKMTLTCVTGPWRPTQLPWVTAGYKHCVMTAS